MPPRLEMQLMRSLTLSYCQARNLVDEGRKSLGMSATEPWTDDLRIECEEIYKRKEKGEIDNPAERLPPTSNQQSKEKEVGKKNEEVVREDNNEIEKMQDDEHEMNDLIATKLYSDKKDQKTDPPDANPLKGEDEEEIGLDQLFNGSMKSHNSSRTFGGSSSHMNSSSNMNSSANLNGSSTANFHDSMWVQTDGLLQEDYADDEEEEDGKNEKKYLPMQIMTKNKKGEKNGINSTHPDGVPKYVYVIKVDDAPIDVIIEEAKKTHSRLRSQSLGRNVTRGREKEKETKEQKIGGSRGRSATRRKKSLSGRSMDSNEGNTRSKSLGKRLTDNIRKSFRKEKKDPIFV